jgi:hypothetical protein
MGCQPVPLPLPGPSDRPIRHETKVDHAHRQSRRVDAIQSCHKVRCSCGQLSDDGRADSTRWRLYGGVSSSPDANVHDVLCTTRLRTVVVFVGSHVLSTTQSDCPPNDPAGQSSCRAGSVGDTIIDADGIQCGHSVTSLLCVCRHNAAVVEPIPAVRSVVADVPP